MKMKAKWISLSALLIALLMAVPAMAAAPKTTVDDYPIVDGSTATLPLSYALMQAATDTTEEVAQATISHSKTTESFYALVDGRADLLLVYKPSQDAYDYAAQMGVKLLEKPIGRDALVFLVNPANPVESLTRDQLVGIYTGKAANWKDVGGSDLPIVAYQRIENSGSQVMMEKQVMQGVPMMEAPKELRTDEMAELIDEVASYKDAPSAIGYSVYYYVHNMYSSANIRLLQVGGVAPENAAIASGDYPFTQDFYAVVRADAPEESIQRKLYDWLTTEEGQALITGAGYVAVAGEEVEK
jgi:ABC-type phosphate transport system substrate-binding protein